MSLAEFHRVASGIGRIPSWHAFAARASVSAETLRKRFGGLQGTLKRSRGWLEENDPNSPILGLMRSRSRHEIPPPPSSEPLHNQRTGPKRSRIERIEYGAPISFRGLRHAPLNEQGVIYVFGMISYELGFLVEAVHAAYPDCEAKRCIDRHRNRWQRVRIEFEFRRSNFQEHGHDAAGCEVIVCWEHDWPECPLEVIELRRAIDSLDG